MSHSGEGKLILPLYQYHKIFIKGRSKIELLILNLFYNFSIFMNNPFKESQNTILRVDSPKVHDCPHCNCKSHQIKCQPITVSKPASPVYANYISQPIKCSYVYT